jgi:hypothetical protein
MHITRKSTDWFPAHGKTADARNVPAGWELSRQEAAMSKAKPNDDPAVKPIGRRRNNRRAMDRDAREKSRRAEPGKMISKGMRRTPIEEFSF